MASWWDYGYQTTAMANRTVIVDNNTWNNTHIATVGRAMSSPERKAWKIYRDLDVDYVFVLFGAIIGCESVPRSQQRQVRAAVKRTCVRACVYDESLRSHLGFSCWARVVNQPDFPQPIPVRTRFRMQTSIACWHCFVARARSRCTH